MGVLHGSTLGTLLFICKNGLSFVVKNVQISMYAVTQVFDKAFNSVEFIKLIF